MRCRSWMLLITVAPMAVLWLAACEPEVLGIIGETDYDEPWVITSPDTVTAGATFQVAFVTMGAECKNNRAVRTDVRVRGNVAELRPYDTGDPGIACRGAATIPHQADVTMVQVGAATLRVFGAGDRHIDKGIWVK